MPYEIEHGLSTEDRLSSHSDTETWSEKETGELELLQEFKNRREKARQEVLDST
jgi:hypothetical protein